MTGQLKPSTQTLDSRRVEDKRSGDLVMDAIMEIGSDLREMTSWELMSSIRSIRLGKFVNNLEQPICSASAYFLRHWLGCLLDLGLIVTPLLGFSS